MENSINNSNELYLSNAGNAFIDNIEIMVNEKPNEVTEELFQSFSFYLSN